MFYKMECEILNYEQTVSMAKLRGCGYSVEKIQELLLKYPNSSKDDPLWALLKKIGQLSPFEIATGKHVPLEGWAKSYIEQVIQDAEACQKTD